MNGFAGAFGGIDPGDPRTIEWVWAKLGELGYWPGPHTNVRAPDDELGRAIRRYRQAHGDLYRRLVHYDGMANDYAIDATVDAQLTTIDADLLTELHAGTNDRMAAGPDSVTTDSNWLAPGHDTRLYVDIDRYYNGDENMHARKAAVERDWVPRPRIPIRATVYLENAAGNPVRAPHRSALGDVRVEWTWDDGQEDHAPLATPSPGQPSYTRAYVDAAKQAAAVEVPATFHNARRVVGGIVDGTLADLAAAFEASPYFVDHSVPNTPIVTGGALDANHVSAASDSLVFFHPSNIGGDRFTLSATLDVPAHAHVNVPAQIRKSTSTVTIWRRARLAAYLRWGNHAPLPNWDGVRAQFEPAFLHLCDPVLDDTIANLGNRGPFEDKVNDSFAGNTPAGAPLTSRRSSANPDEFHYRFDPNHVFPEDPRTLEFQQTHAIGIGQFSDPKDVVNQLMIEPLRSIMAEFRSARNPLNYKQPKPAQLAKRLALAQLWANDGRGWVQAVGQHFVGEISPMLNGAALQIPACPADRVIAPLPAASMAAAPATRAAILDALLLDPVRPILDAWMQHQTPLPAVGPLTTISAFLRVLSQDLAALRRALWPVNPMIERAQIHYSALLRDRVGRPTSMMNHAINLKTHDIEAWIPGADQAAFAVGLGAFNLTSATAAVAGADYQLYRLTHTNTATFDPVAFATYVDDTHHGTHDLLRGPGAALPAFVVPDEDRMNAIHLEQLVEIEKKNTSQQLSAYGVFTDVVTPLDDLVHAQNPRPPGGLIVVHYAAHPRPVRLESGSGVDLADFTNSTSMGLSAGIVFVSEDQPLKKNHLFAHEIGHCLFMRHWQKGEEGIVTGFSEPDDHDHADSNCIMSYSAFERTTCHTHFDVNSYDPHFCGKCVLKLRGWDIAATTTAGQPLLPVASQNLTPVFPNVPAVQAVTTDAPALGLMDTELHHLATNLGANITTYPPPFPDEDSLRFYEHGAPVVKNGRTVFARQAIAVTQHPGGVVLPATARAWEHGDAGTLPTDATLLHTPNTHVVASWEDNVLWYIHKGGATNCSGVPPESHITFNTTSPRYYDPCTPFHEVVHFYQRWDQSMVYEGITEVFAGMLTHRYVTAHAPGPDFVWALNPSYLQMTQFTVDELLPRLGIDGLARLYFNDANGNILKPILRPGVNVSAFTTLCKEGIARYDMSDAAAALLPIGARPPVTPPNPAVATELDATLQAITDYFTANTPAVLPPANRALAAALLRLELKVDVWKDTVTMVEGFRDQVDATNRVHRLERSIEESNADLADFRRRYAAFGGNPADVA